MTSYCEFDRKENIMHRQFMANQPGIRAAKLSELARVLGMKPRSLWEQARAGKIETIRQGRIFIAVVRDPVVIELLAAQETADATSA